MIRLMEILLHGGTQLGGWRARQIHQAVLAAYTLSDQRYSLNQLRYDLRKMKAHGLIERLFHKQLCGPLANSLFHHQPNAQLRPQSKLETAYYKADASIRNIIELLEAA